MADLWIELIGWSAGLTNLSSSTPQLVANLRDPSRAAGQSAWRNALQAAGNLLWIAYGALIGSLAMMVFATLGFIMAAWLLAQVRRAQQP